MLNNWNSDYAEAHRAITTELRGLQRRVRGLAKREAHATTADSSGAQALALERAQFYLDSATWIDHAIGSLERAEEHVKEHQPK